MKKQNYFFTIAFFFLLLVSCRKQPKCNQEEVQKLVIETIKQHISDKVRKDFEEKDFTENALKEAYQNIDEKLIENYLEQKDFFDNKYPIISNSYFKSQII